MKHSFKKSVLFVMIALTLAFSALGVTPAHGGGGLRHAKPTATGTGDCFSWANACTLQTALTGATSGNEIWVKAGTHKPTTGPNRSKTRHARGLWWHHPDYPAPGRFIRH